MKVIVFSFCWNCFKEVLIQLHSHFEAASYRTQILSLFWACSVFPLGKWQTEVLNSTLWYIFECWFKLFIPNTMHKGNGGAVHTWKKDINLRKRFDVIVKFNWQWNSKVTVWLMFDVSRIGPCASFFLLLSFFSRKVKSICDISWRKLNLRNKWHFPT